LSSSQAAALLAQHGPNRLPSSEPRGVLQQLGAVLREPMLLLLIGAALISFTLSEPLEATILLLSALFVVGISFYQKRKTDRALEALKVLSAPRAHAVRDGELRSISSDEVVTGDLLVVREGDRVPADARVTEASNLSVDESTMTGEAFSVDKGVGDRVLSGTLVVRGHGQAVVVATGRNAEIGHIGAVLERTPNKRTPLQSEVDGLVWRVAIVSLLSALAVTVIYGLTRANWLEGALAGIAAAMSLLPEELPIVLTVFLGLGAWRLSRLGVIVRSSPAIELLGQISVLCVDKTGTITQNEMTLVDHSPAVSFYGLLASPEHPFDPMDRAFHAASTRDDRWQLVREYPLSDTRLAICQAWETETGEIQFSAKGAPEAIARLCRVSDGQREALLQLVDENAHRGFRVLGVARQTLPAGTVLPEDPAEIAFEFVGLALLSDPVRTGVADAVRTVSQAGVRTIMMTGDYPVTAMSVAREIGIEGTGEVLTGPEVDALDDEQLRQAVHRVSVFSRVLPSQKLRLVEALQSTGEVVAMTGDGVNDAPALRASNVGIAMGRRGAEVAREASDIVITDDSFVSIVNGIGEGRRIYANLRRAAAYIIAVHVPIFGMALLPVTSPAWPLILLPAQIVLLELLIDPAGSLGYEAEKLSPQEMRRPPRAVGERMINRRIVFLSLVQGMFLLLGSGGVFLWAIFTGLPEGEVRALSFATILLGNLLLMLSNRSLTASLAELLLRRGNNQVYVIFGLGLLLMALLFIVGPVREAFRLELLSLDQWLLVIGSASLSVIWLESYKAISRWRLRSHINGQ
jgi:P-type Ca2+ transporter type 2C